MKELLQGIVIAKKSYDEKLTEAAEEASRMFIEAAEFLKEHGVEEHRFTTASTVSSDSPDFEFDIDIGLVWNGSFFGYYFSEEVDHDTRPTDLPNILGQRREVRVDAARNFLPGLLAEISSKYKKMTDDLSLAGEL